MRRDQLAKAEKALAELFYRNEQRNDHDAYELDLAAWGLGIKDERPLPLDFGVHEIDFAQAAEFFNSMKDFYREIEEEE